MDHPVRLVDVPKLMLPMLRASEFTAQLYRNRTESASPESVMGLSRSGNCGPQIGKLEVACLDMGCQDPLSACPFLEDIDRRRKTVKGPGPDSASASSSLMPDWSEPLAGFHHSKVHKLLAVPLEWHRVLPTKGRDRTTRARIGP